MTFDLSRLLAPNSVTVIGASRFPKKAGAIILRNILESGFKGKVYPVNPKAPYIQDLETYPNVMALPETPDLSVIAVPAEIVPEVLTQLGEREAKNVIVISAGFKETGTKGKNLEKQIAQIANKYSINLLGPNCLGIVNNSHPINATFAQSVQIPGNLRFITQSGAIASSLFDWFDGTDLGYSEFITLGNKAILNENDFLQYFLDTPVPKLMFTEGTSSLSPIGLYLESISNGQRFLDITARISKQNPILLLKPGKTEAAATAMQTHTGSIAGSYDVLKAATEESGIILCETLEDFFSLARAFAWSELPSGPNVAIVSNAGGPAVISADSVVTNGLQLANLNEETSSLLKESLPREVNIKDPVDILGDALADRYTQVIEALMRDNHVDSLVVILTPQVMTEIEKTAEQIGKLWEKYKKPIFCSFIGGKNVAEGENILNSYKIPSFRFPEQAINSIATMWDYKQFRDKQQGSDDVTPTIRVEPNKIQHIINKSIQSKETSLGNVEADTILKLAGINTPPTKYINTLEEATVFAMDNGWPVVLKLSAPGLIHKKDVRGVITDIKTANMLGSALNQLEHVIETLPADMQNKVKIQIQKQIVKGVEIIVGTKKDATFGHILLFGAGGTLAELIQDKNIAIHPITPAKAERLILHSKIFNVLKGGHGEEAYAVNKLQDVLLRISVLAETLTEHVDSIEINPLIVTQNDVWAVDGKVVLHKEVKPKPAPPKLQSATCTKHEVLATQFNYLEFKAEYPLLLKPGQYISVKVDPKNIRAYSVATVKDEYNFGLLVDTRPGGPGSQFFAGLKVGDEMSYLGPFGVFTFNRHDHAKRLLFLATGSGISAIRCMIDTALEEYKETRPMTLYFGLTYEKEIFWKEHFEELQQKYNNFNFEYCIWKPTKSWKGASGFITTLIEENFKDAHDTSAYLCGHPAMIENATEVLLANGCSKDRIHKERFS